MSQLTNNPQTFKGDIAVADPFALLLQNGSRTSSLFHLLGATHLTDAAKVTFDINNVTEAYIDSNGLTPTNLNLTNSNVSYTPVFVPAVVGVNTQYYKVRLGKLQILWNRHVDPLGPTNNEAVTLAPADAYVDASSYAVLVSAESAVAVKMSYAHLGGPGTGGTQFTVGADAPADAITWATIGVVP